MRAFTRFLASVAAAVAVAGCSPGFLSLDRPGSTPTGPSNSTFTFAGRVTTTQTGAALPGALVTVGGTSVTSSQDGSFSVALGATASSVTVTAPGFLTRTTTVAGGANRSNTIDLISTAAPFDLDFFDRLARGKDQTGVFPSFVLPWPANPNFYVITKFTTQDGTGAFVSSDQDVPAATINRIVAILPGLVAGISGNRIQAGSIQTRPDARATIEAGWIQVEVASRGAGSANDLCGFGGVNVALQSNVEFSRTGFARMYNAPNCGCGAELPANLIIAHEVGHALGFGHTQPHRDSVMSYQTDIACSTTAYSPRDQYHGQIAYARQLGNSTPDNDAETFQLRRFGSGRTTTVEYACRMPGR